MRVVRHEYMSEKILRMSIYFAYVLKPTSFFHVINRWTYLLQRH